jgi:hypothetical protein
MVLKPGDYTNLSLDFDVLLSNYHNIQENLKNKRKSKTANAEEIKLSEDVSEARKIARALIKNLNLLPQHPEEDDYIFHGENFYDVLECLDWVKELPNGKATSKQRESDPRPGSSKFRIPIIRESSSELSSLSESN